MSPQLQSEFIKHAVAHLLLPWIFSYTQCPVKFSTKNFANKIHFICAYLCQKGVELGLYSCAVGWTLNIHAQWANIWAVFIPYWNYTVAKVGSGMG